jgi:hypothetical protein
MKKQKKKKRKETIKIKSMVKNKGPFGDAQPPSWLSGSRTDVPTEPPSHQ